jgi:hypothetical protein
MSTISQSFINDAVNHMFTTYVKNVIELLSTKHGFNKDEAYLAYIGMKNTTATVTYDNKKKTKIKTEDTGKEFEMALCLALGTPYNGAYKYGMETPEKLKKRLAPLITQNLFPICKHTASNGSRYDFTSLDDDSIHLSAKTTKKGVGMVAPQVIGQPSPQKFCDIVGLTFTTKENLKTDIQTNITTILPFLVDYTFDCSTLFYNKKKDTIRFIKMIRPIVWDNHIFTWTCYANADVANINKVWKNSTRLKIKNGDDYISLVEFQFHEKERTNMVVRWCYENVLTIFKDNFSVIHL